MHPVFYLATCFPKIMLPDDRSSEYQILHIFRNSRTGRQNSRSGVGIRGWHCSLGAQEGPEPPAPTRFPAFLSSSSFHQLLTFPASPLRFLGFPLLLHPFRHLSLPPNSLMCVRAFITGMSIILKNWKQPKCPSTGEQVNILKHIYSMECYAIV